MERAITEAIYAQAKQARERKDKSERQGETFAEYAKRLSERKYTKEPDSVLRTAERSESVNTMLGRTDQDSDIINARVERFDTVILSVRLLAAMLNAMGGSIVLSEIEIGQMNLSELDIVMVIKPAHTSLSLNRRETHIA